MSLAITMADYLRSKGIDAFGVKRIKRYSDSLLHDVLLQCLLNGLTVTESNSMGTHLTDELGIGIYRITNYGKPLKFTVSPGSIDLDLSVLPRYPMFIIDMKLWGYLSEEERTDLVRQIGLSISTIRKYLWDGNLLVMNPPSDLKARLQRMFRGFSFLLNETESTQDAVVLDPYADNNIDEKKIKEGKAFIIGGIVDKGKRFDHATQFLSRLSGYTDLERYRITLRSSVIGVPDRINKIIEVILKVRHGLTLESAILQTQTKADKISRARYELSRGNDVSWLGMDEETVKKIEKGLGKNLK